LLVGTSSARSNYSGITPNFQFENGSGNDQRSFAITHNDTNTAGPIVFIGKSRGSTVGSNTVVASGDELGQITFNGADGTNMILAAKIIAEVDGTPGANDMPGRLVFSTTADGASSPTERMRIQNTGTISSYADLANPSLTLRNATSAGTSTVFIQGLFSASGTTSGGAASFYVFTNGDVANAGGNYGPISSDERLKQDIVDAGSQWDDIKAVRLTKFRYKNDPTGELQLGPIAQELEQVSPGLVTRRPASEDEIADPSNDLVDGDEVLSFKASILYMKAVKALQEAMTRIEALEAEVTALKGGTTN
jgi:hypothetical protein